MPWDCVKCGYSSETNIEECPDCGGAIEIKDPKIDWMGDKKEKPIKTIKDSSQKDKK